MTDDKRQVAQLKRQVRALERRLEAESHGKAKAEAESAEHLKAAQMFCAELRRVQAENARLSENVREVAETNMQLAKDQMKWESEIETLGLLELASDMRWEAAKRIEAMAPDKVVKLEQGAAYDLVKHRWDYWAKCKAEGEKPGKVFRSYQAWCLEAGLEPKMRRTFDRRTTSNGADS